MRLRSMQKAYNPAVWGGAYRDAHRQSLGQILIDQVVITPEQNAKILADQRETGQLYGEAAIASGFAEPIEIQRALEVQSRFTVLDPDDDRVDPQIIAAFDPNDDFSQSIRALRSSLSGVETNAGEPIKTIAIVGIDTAVECGIVAANLAVVCSQAGYRTILVDTNTNFATQNLMFKVSNRLGVTSLLTNRVNGIDVLQPTALPNLAVIPAGPAMPNSAELFERAPLFHRLHPLLGTHDFIVVDAATLTPELACCACDGADGVLIVVRQNHSSSAELQERIAQFEARGIPIIGSIFTN